MCRAHRWVGCSRRATPRRATPHHAAPRHTMPRRATPRHANPHGQLPPTPPSSSRYSQLLSIGPSNCPSTPPMTSNTECHLLPTSPPQALLERFKAATSQSRTKSSDFSDPVFSAAAYFVVTKNVKQVHGSCTGALRFPHRTSPYLTPPHTSPYPTSHLTTPHPTPSHPTCSIMYTLVAWLCIRWSLESYRFAPSTTK